MGWSRRRQAVNGTIVVLTNEVFQVVYFYEPKLPVPGGTGVGLSVVK